MGVMKSVWKWKYMEEYKKTHPPIQYVLEKLTIYMFDRKFRERYIINSCVFVVGQYRSEVKQSVGSTDPNYMNLLRHLTLTFELLI